MAELENKYPENADGKYYVDDTCIDCDNCWTVAPTNFARAEDSGYSYVRSQPINEEEEELCQEALEGCPVNAIGDDGNY